MSEIKFEAFVFEAAYGTSAQLPPATVPEIAFAGRSNVGKSSLINKLLNRKSLARTSSVPGKTVTVNFYRSGDVRFADLPGYGYAKVSQSEKKRWALLMEHYFTSGRDIRLVVALADIRHPLTRDDRDMIAYLRSAGVDFVVVLTKSDKLNKTERAKREAELPLELAEFGNPKTLIFSAQTGEGTAELKEIILNSMKDQ